jgi:hypothetical protein
MALHNNVKKDNILCELCADTYFDLSDDCKTEILDTDCDVPTTGFQKQLPSCPLFSTSVSATSRVKGKKVVNQTELMMKQASKHKMQENYSKYSL